MLNRVLRPFMVLILFCALLLAASLASGQERTAQPDRTPELTASPEATEIPVPAQVELYEPLTLRAQIEPGRYSNPFDPEDIELIGIFRAPSTRQIVIPGFWMQPYEDVCHSPCLQENLQPVGDPEWQVRFTPTEVGEWSYLIQVRDNGSVISTVDGEFTVVPSERRGFIRVAPNRRYFQYDNGEPYFVIGHNLNWSWDGAGGVHAFERWLKSLSDSGGNFARVYVDVPWFIGLEWDALGSYAQAQDDAARLDRLLDLAEEHGVALQLVLLWNQALRTYTGTPVMLPQQPARPEASADWDDNPYNSARGGPLSGPTLFFSNPTAEDMFRRRLRYYVARWGYSPQVFAWELIDEIDQINVSDPAVKHAWLRDMAGYIRQIDQQQHLVTAGSREFNQQLSANPMLDFTQARLFQRLPIETVGEQEVAVIERVRRYLEAGAGPTLLTSFSLNPWFEPVESDPEGVHVQNSLWAAALAGAAGGGASAWGETYVIPGQLQRYYAPLAAFASGVDWGALDLRPAEAALLMEDAAYTPVRVAEFDRDFRETPGPPLERTISPEGVYPPLSGVSSYLYGRVYNTTLGQSQTYRVTVPVDTYFEVGVRTVSDLAGARLRIQVDGESVAEMALSTSARPAALRVPLATGEHTIVLDNVGEDWLNVEYLEVGQLTAPARVLTLRDSRAGVALAWLQHRDYTWERVAAGEEREPLQFTYRLDRMPPGRYRAELWDPLTGAVLGEEMLRVREDGVLRFELLPLTRQLAIRVFRQQDSTSAAPIPTSLPTPSPAPATESTPAVGTQDSPSETSEAPGPTEPVLGFEATPEAAQGTPAADNQA